MSEGRSVEQKRGERGKEGRTDLEYQRKQRKEGRILFLYLDDVAVASQGRKIEEGGGRRRKKNDASGQK